MDDDEPYYPASLEAEPLSDRTRRTVLAVAIGLVVVTVALGVWTLLIGDEAHDSLPVWSTATAAVAVVLIATWGVSGFPLRTWTRRSLVAVALLLAVAIPFAVAMTHYEALTHLTS
ncbi:hypothetical protein [Leifsonia sp. EB41]|uniref:hypothetical protein n=1 Tax=Leifsonia sp. EB41 TaxID=3156260 RepID=UPI003515B065